MKMQNTTKKLIIMALEADSEVNNDTIQSILYELKQSDYIPKPVSEKKAAEILGIPYTTLNNWRHNRGRGSEEFAFSIMINPAASGVLYDEIELKRYVKNKFSR